MDVENKSVDNDWSIPRYLKKLTKNAEDFNTLN